MTGRTITIKAPDELAPTLDRVLAYWRPRPADEQTLLLVPQHGRDMMGYRSDRCPAPTPMHQADNPGEHISGLARRAHAPGCVRISLI